MLAVEALAAASLAFVTAIAFCAVAKVTCAAPLVVASLALVVAVDAEDAADVAELAELVADVATAVVLEGCLSVCLSSFSSSLCCLRCGLCSFNVSYINSQC